MRHYLLQNALLLILGNGNRHVRVYVWRNAAALKHAVLAGGDGAAGNTLAASYHLPPWRGPGAYINDVMPVTISAVYAAGSAFAQRRAQAVWAAA